MNELSIPSRIIPRVAFLFWFLALLPTGARSAALPFDLVVEKIDVNGWPLNPKWGAQTGTNPSLPDPYKCPGLEPWNIGTCTSTQNWSDASSWKCPDTAFDYVWYPGHINFCGATFTGPIEWSDRSSNDDDYNFVMGPAGAAGLTASNPGGLQLEFDSGETIDNFHTSWWNALHNAVDKDNDAAAAMMHGKEAIAFGVFGLDCAHTCSSELHPVFALAIHVQNDPNDDVWTFFVRNWGNEGYCSSGAEVLDDSINEFTFTLPRPGATAVAVTSSEFLCRGLGGAGPYVQVAPSDGATVTFAFPKASERERINGVLHLRWTIAEPAPKRVPPALLAMALKPEHDQPESRHWLWTQLMNPQQRAVYEKLRPVSEKSADSMAPRKLAAENRKKPLKRPVDWYRKQISQFPDKVRDAKDRRELEAIQKAYEGRIPIY